MVVKNDQGNPQKGINLKDTWKVENGQLVEHWDAIQPIDGFMRLFAVFAGGFYAPYPPSKKGGSIDQSGKYCIPDMLIFKIPKRKYFQKMKST